METRRNQPHCCQGCGLLDHCRFFVANGDNSVLISRAGRTCVPGSRGVRATLLLIITGSVRGPSRIHCPLALQGQRGSGGQRSKNSFQEERSQQKPRKKMEETGVY